MTATSPTVLIARDGIPQGQKFIVTYFNIWGATLISGSNPVDGLCNLFLLTTDGTANTTATFGTVPLHANDGGLAASEMAYLPLNSGEGLAFGCRSITATGARPNTSFATTVGGYFAPTS